jgi:excisionase family DNA binding protein
VIKGEKRMPLRLGLSEVFILLSCFVVFIVVVGVLAVLVLRSRPTASGAKERHDEDLPQVMTVDEVATLLRVDAGVVEELIQDGRLPAVKVGQEWRISRTHVIAFINAD